jgi:hypothetical protein
MAHGPGRAGSSEIPSREVGNGIGAKHNGPELTSDIGFGAGDPARERSERMRHDDAKPAGTGMDSAVWMGDGVGSGVNERMRERGGRRSTVEG